ncbi:hypothetical protein K1719_030281 [Acacia pycnantha]|nr:hypothetical protein K1719_030281 [Acacia pycnantha]
MIDPSAYLGFLILFLSVRKNLQWTILDTITKFFSKGTVEEIVLSLEKEIEVEGAEKWISDALNYMRTYCPTSLKIWLRSGSRAKLFDKDNRAMWDPPKLELVSEEMVDQYFREVEDENWELLQLPHRSNTLSKL